MTFSLARSFSAARRRSEVGSDPLPNLARICRRVWGAVAAVVLGIAAASGAHGLVDEDLVHDSWTYELVREMDLRGHPLVTFGHERPYAHRELVEGLRRLRAAVETGRVHLSREERWILEALEREFETERAAADSAGDAFLAAAVWADGRFIRDEAGESRWRAQGFGEVGLRLGTRTTLYHRFQGDTRPEDDPGLLAEPWRERAVGLTEPAYLLWQSSRWRFLFGRERLDWGPGTHGGLVFSWHAPPLDMLKADVRFSDFHGTAFAAVLDAYDLPAEGGGSTRVARYLSGHRLGWRPCESLEVGAAEVVVYGGEDRLPEVRYLMPLFFFYVEQWNSGHDDNPIWAFDVSWRSKAGLRLYGEYLVDDFQYDFHTEPQEIGFLVGVEVADPLGLSGSGVGVEYARVNRWTYGQNKPWNRYLNHGVGMGHPLGPDADGVWIRGVRQIAHVARLHVEYGRVRRGEGRIEDERPWSVPSEDRFLSGVVETRSSLTCALELFPSASGWFLGEVGWARTTNPGHEAGEKTGEFTARVRCRVGLERFWPVR